LIKNLIRNPRDDFFQQLVTDNDLDFIWSTWFNKIVKGRFRTTNPGWQSEYRDLVVEIMKNHYHYHYMNKVGNRISELQKAMKYFDPLTRDFHVQTSTKWDSCESISIYAGFYNIPANDPDHPYHMI
jgi:hypothetical protein